MFQQRWIAKRDTISGCLRSQRNLLYATAFRHSNHPSSSYSSSAGKRPRDLRLLLAASTSLAAASTFQYYLHNRTLLTSATGPVSSSPIAESYYPTPKVQALSVFRRAFGASASAVKEEKEAPAAPLGGLPITLYQYKICPFCCKVKAVLDFYKIPYETMEVNPLTKAEIKFSPDYRKVPIAKLGEEVVKDSSTIVNHLAELLRQHKVAPSQKLDSFFSSDAQRWAGWADAQLAVLLFPNITRSFDEAYSAFSYVKDVPHFTAIDKWSNLIIGSTFMWAAQGKLKKKYNIDNEREALFTALKDFCTEVGDKPFLSGTEPNLGDICVYACLRAIEGLDAHKDIMANTDIGTWYQRVEKAIGDSSCTKAE